MNAFFRLPLQPDLSEFKKDLVTCLSFNWQDHFHREDYSGTWSVLALRSASGAVHDIASHPGAEYRNTELMEACPAFRMFFDSLNCEKETIRLLRLTPGSTIHTHRDRGAGYAHGNFRLHIPLRTHAEISFVVDGMEVPMQEGECWYADFDRPHSVANRGTQDRIHLVIDCLRNEWSDEIFGAAGYDFSVEKQGPDPDTMKRMIAELEHIDSDAAREIIQQLKFRLNEA